MVGRFMKLTAIMGLSVLETFAGVVKGASQSPAKEINTVASLPPTVSTSDAEASIARRLGQKRQGIAGMFQYDNFMDWLMQNLFGICFGIVFNTTAACVYKFRVVNKAPVLEQAGVASSESDFTPGLNDCMHDRSMCCMLCFFGPCRVGHTWHVAGILNYWLAILIHPFCGSCVGGFVRTKLKRKMGLKTSFGTECMIHCKSQCCALGQEALAVDAAGGVKMRCCRLEKVEPPAQATMGKPSPPVLLQSGGPDAENCQKAAQVAV